MSSGSSVFDALAVIADFDDALLELDGRDASQGQGKRKRMFLQHLQKMDKLNFIIPDFEKNLDWLNVSEPLSMSKKLKGHLVVLDFFTYCCINCMHILPDLEVLEKQHPPDSGVAVIGVHSAKFLNEKVTANILSAILRYHIHHPIVNDSEARLWQELSIACWPTLIFVGPSSQFLYSLAGEGHLNKILEFIEIAKEHYTNLGLLKPQPLPIFLEVEKRKPSVLSFPGKVKFWKEHDWLVISDSGHHRIIITDVAGIVQEIIGNGACAFKNGNFSEASFSSPQGVACWKHFIFVADTENHAVRLVDMTTKNVSTLCGTGKQGVDKEGGLINTDQEISSPWDVCLGKSPQNKDALEPDVLYIAMAGLHQIWVYFLKDALWYKNRHYTKGTCVKFAGSGREENRNNSYPEKASFAQPSGLALSQSRNILYVADSESSSIRSVSLTDGKVSAVVGGEKDPMNLFAFGDVDGKGVNAKLQHPLGVALQAADGPLLVADSYNHKIKIVDTKTHDCTTFAGTGQPGQEANQNDLLACQFSEPGGLTCDETNKKIYVADTNNNSIKIVDFTSNSMSELPIIFPKDENIHMKHQMDNKEVECLPPVSVSVGTSKLTLTLNISVPEGHHFNEDAPNHFKIGSVGDAGSDLSKLLPSMDMKGKILLPQPTYEADGRPSIDLPLADDISAGSYSFELSVQYFLCINKGNVCLPPKTCKFRQTVHVVAK